MFHVAVGNQRKFQEGMLFVAFSLYVLSLPIRPCSLSEFTLAEPQWYKVLVSITILDCVFEITE